MVIALSGQAIASRWEASRSGRRAMAVVRDAAGSVAGTPRLVAVTYTNRHMSDDQHDTDSEVPKADRQSVERGRAVRGPAHRVSRRHGRRLSGRKVGDRNNV